MSEESFKTKYLQLQEFLAGIAHELRTPLNGMIGISEILIQSEQDTTRIKHLNMLKSCATRLTGLTDSIVDFTSFREGKTTLVLSENVQLNDICSEVYDLTINGLDARGKKIKKDTISFEKSFASDMPLIKADRDRLVQVVYNIVQNAFKFTASGFVKMSTRLDGDYVEFSCSDSGKGIKGGFMDRIMDPFSQEQEGVGLGLGLAVSSYIVDLHGGTISVNSDGSTGSLFTVRLPRVPPAVAVEKQLASPLFRKRESTSAPKDLMDIIACAEKVLTSAEKMSGGSELKTELESLEKTIAEIQIRVSQLHNSALTAKKNDDLKCVPTAPTDVSEVQYFRQILEIMELEHTRDKLLEDNRGLAWKIQELQQQLDQKSVPKPPKSKLAMLRQTAMESSI